MVPAKLHSGLFLRQGNDSGVFLSGCALAPRYLARLLNAANVARKPSFFFFFRVFHSDNSSRRRFLALSLSAVSNPPSPPSLPETSPKPNDYNKTIASAFDSSEISPLRIPL